MGMTCTTGQERTHRQVIGSQKHDAMKRVPVSVSPMAPGHRVTGKGRDSFLRAMQFRISFLTCGTRREPRWRG